MTCNENYDDISLWFIVCYLNFIVFEHISTIFDSILIVFIGTSLNNDPTASTKAPLDEFFAVLLTPLQLVQRFVQ